MRESISKKDKITNKQSYKWDDSDREIAWYYYNRGKKSDQVRWGRETTFNEEGKVIEERRIGRKGIAYSVYKHKYNSSQQIESSEYINLKKNKKLYRYEYIYNEKDLLVEKLRFDKKNVLVNKYTTMYDYY